MAKKKNKRKLNWKAITIAAIGIIVLVLIIAFAFNSMFKKKTNNPENTPSVSQKENGSGYSIRSNATNYQEELNKELKTVLKDGTKLEIAESVAKNFVADFFTLSNKTIKNDIGGAQYWGTSARINFRDKATNTFYKNLELYIKDYGSKNLPIVTDVTVNGSEQIIDPNGSPFYYVDISWKYSAGNNFPVADIQTNAYIELAIIDGQVYIYNFY